MKKLGKKTNWDVESIHKDLVNIAKATIISEKTSYKMADTFTVISDATRIRILSALFTVEMCVCDLANALSMTQSAISHQLKLLRDQKLVKARKEGRMVFYALDDDHIRHFIQIAKEHIDHGND